MIKQSCLLAILIILMKIVDMIYKTFSYRLIIVSFGVALASCLQTQNIVLQRNTTEKENIIDGVVWESGNWKPHLPAGEKGKSWGNHRAVVKIKSYNRFLGIRIHWRRSDNNPKDKAVVVIDAQSGEPIINVFLKEINNEFGEIIFEPNQGSKLYHIYYFPFESTGGYYPKINYLGPKSSANEDWLRSLGEINDTLFNGLPQGVVTHIQSVDNFHSFYPMEVIAKKSEIEKMVKGINQSYYLFPEDRNHSIRMINHIPKRWINRGLINSFEDSGQQGEYFTFQIGVWAKDQMLEDISVAFTDFISPSGSFIKGSEFTCFNLGGVDINGSPFNKSVLVQKGKVQALWFGVQLPEQSGKFKGQINISSKNASSENLSVTISIGDRIVANRGDDQPENMSRLRWLNSTVGKDPDFIIPPFTPVEIQGKRLIILGREILLSENGLPNQINSFFTPEMTGFQDTPNPIIRNPIDFKVTVNGKDELWKSIPYDLAKDSRRRSLWFVENESDNFNLYVNGVLEYEGMLDYKISLVAKNEVLINNIQVPIHVDKDAAKYILGLGHKGQKRPNKVNWKWDVTNHQEGVWLGGINKGLQYVLRDNNYVRPLNTNFYQNQPLVLPSSWANNGKGGINIIDREDYVLVQNYSGPRMMSVGDTLHYNIRFLITPFKPLNLKNHFQTRFVHKYVPVDTVLAWGGTVVNIHHANAINPFINYPFYNLDKQTAYIQEAHQKNVKVKLYNTIRELTYKTHEIFAMRSLGFEIFNDGVGGGHSWLQEHLKDNYHSAWHAWRVDDAAILNKGTSRWTNYYIEGLNWLAKNQDIDGLYLDDIAFNRETVKRIVSVLNKHRPEVIIDLHSANQFNSRDGFINSAMLYMEHFPFISRLWFGEYFEYDKDEDYWLTEVSGIPFGLMGEMLQGGGHPYRGLLYGMTTRMYGETDVRPIWKLMNDFGIESSEIKGYWLEKPPVITNHEKIIATAYLKPEKILIAIASWSDKDENVRLDFDWNQLGFKSGRLFSPEVDKLQPYEEFNLEGPITIPQNMGLFLVLEKK